MEHHHDDEAISLVFDLRALLVMGSFLLEIGVTSMMGDRECVWVGHGYCRGAGYLGMGIEMIRSGEMHGLRDPG